MVAPLSTVKRMPGFSRTITASQSGRLLVLFSLTARWRAAAAVDATCVVKSRVVGQTSPLALRVACHADSPTSAFGLHRHEVDASITCCCWPPARYWTLLALRERRLERPEQRSLTAGLGNRLLRRTLPANAIVPATTARLERASSWLRHAVPFGSRFTAVDGPFISRDWSGRRNLVRETAIPLRNARAHVAPILRRHIDGMPRQPLWRGNASGVIAAKPSLIAAALLAWAEGMTRSITPARPVAAQRARRWSPKPAALASVSRQRPSWPPARAGRGASPAAIAMHGEPALAAGFPETRHSLPIPAAPKGGRHLAFAGAFDVVGNPYARPESRNLHRAGLAGNVYQSLMTRSLDEPRPFTLYGLVAQSVETGRRPHLQ